MKVHLLFSDRDFELGSTVIPNELTITTDLQLATLWGSYGSGR